jgi:uncharacterized protein (TIGR02246 family)
MNTMNTTNTLTRTKTLTRLDVEALFGSLREAWNAGDSAAIAATFAPDGRLVDPLGDEWDGREAISAAYQEYFGGLLAGTTTEIVIASVRELAPGLAVVDGWQTISGPLPRMHLTAIVRAEGDTAQVVECRPYILLELPPES